MTFESLQSRVHEFQAEGKALFVSSSFQTHSLPLLHMLSRIDAAIPVAFLNTGFLFPETLAFRDEVVARLNLKLINLSSEIPRIQQRDAVGNFFYVSDTDRCCEMNKTMPMASMLQQYDVWINGVRRDQSAHRQTLQVEHTTGYRCLRFHPLLDWTASMIEDYRRQFDLPSHPLEAQGYLSIGCEPCTRRISGGNRNEARWFGQQKTECGLHTRLIQNEAENR